MRVRCPHCYNPLEVIDDSSFENIVCSSCGSNFSLIGDTEATATSRRSPRSIGHFDLIESLGVGAFGTVWKARDTQLDRTVAIKVPRKGQLSDAETEQLQEHENDATLDTVARVFYLQGDLQKAIEWQKKAVEVATEKNREQLREHLQRYEAARNGENDVASPQ